MPRISPELLPEVLAKGLASSYLVSGDEPLLTGEAADLIRGHAKRAHFVERQIFHIERHFDWSVVRHAARNLSLFGERKLIELRLPTGKPDRGAETLLELIESDSAELLVLVLTGKLDQKSADAAWVRALSACGVWVQIKPVERADLPGWLRARARHQSAALDEEAAELISERVEGNLLAAAQELTKLSLLSAGQTISAKLVLASVADSAHYDIFDLASAASAGESERALHIFDSLAAQGTEPTLVLWALMREIRGCWQAHFNRQHRSNERLSRWNLANPPTNAAMARTSLAFLAPLLCEGAHIDRIIKGFEPNADRWQALRALTAALAGSLPGELLQPRWVA